MNYDDAAMAALIVAVRLGVLTIVFAIIFHGAYRLGHAAGLSEGAIRERERRDGLEARIRRQIEAAAERDAEMWNTEIDA